MLSVAPLRTGVAKSASAAMSGMTRLGVADPLTWLRVAGAPPPRAGGRPAAAPGPRDDPAGRLHPAGAAGGQRGGPTAPAGLPLVAAAGADGQGGAAHRRDPGVGGWEAGGEAAEKVKTGAEVEADPLDGALLPHLLESGAEPCGVGRRNPGVAHDAGQAAVGDVGEGVEARESAQVVVAPGAQVVDAGVRRHRVHGLDIRDLVDVHGIVPSPDAVRTGGVQVRGNDLGELARAQRLSVAGAEGGQVLGRGWLPPWTYHRHR